MKKLFIVCSISLFLIGCGKTGMVGSINQSIGNWAEIDLPKGCIVKQIAAGANDSGGGGTGGIAILCQDGRIFQ